MTPFGTFPGHFKHPQKIHMDLCLAKNNMLWTWCIVSCGCTVVHGQPQELLGSSSLATCDGKKIPSLKVQRLREAERPANPIFGVVPLTLGRHERS